jgi:hypothetical protein
MEAMAMPSKSAQQHRLMEAAAHNPQFAEKAGIPPKVAKQFIAEDKKLAKRSSSKRSGKKRKS